jgi:hypothetical protein
MIPYSATPYCGLATPGSNLAMASHVTVVTAIPDILVATAHSCRYATSHLTMSYILYFAATPPHLSAPPDVKLYRELISSLGSLSS